MEFVDGVGVLTVAIHEETHDGDAILAGIARVLNVMVQSGMRRVWVGASHQVVIFQGLLALLVIAPS